MLLNSKIGFLILVFNLASIQVFANQIICRDPMKQVVMSFKDRGPIPDYGFESFRYHSSYGEIIIHGKNYGETWMTVRNGGMELSYEITVKTAARTPMAYVHLSLSKSGVFNGYLQSDGSDIVLLECFFED